MAVGEPSTQKQLEAQGKLLQALDELRWDKSAGWKHAIICHHEHMI